MHRITRRVLIAGVAGAAIVGSGAAAMAVTESASVGSSTEAAATAAGTTATATATATTAATAAPGAAAGSGAAHRFARRAVTGQAVVRGKNGAYVTHDLVRGTVTAVSATSITVKAPNGVSETYAVNGQTKVRLRSAGKGTPSSIGHVAVGDHALVTGTGTGALSAKHIVDSGK